MFLYATIILICTMALGIINSIISVCTEAFSLVYVFIAILINVLAMLLIDCLISLTIHFLPKNWFNPQFKLFSEKKFEKKLYDVLKVKQWKDYLPQVSFFCFQVKKKNFNGTNQDYVSLFLTETCYVEITALLCAFLGFLVVSFSPTQIKLCVALPVAIVNLLLFVPIYLAQRYNRPKLLNINEKNQ